MCECVFINIYINNDCYLKFLNGNGKMKKKNQLVFFSYSTTYRVSLTL